MKAATSCSGSERWTQQHLTRRKTDDSLIRGGNLDIADGRGASGNLTSTTRGKQLLPGFAADRPVPSPEVLLPMVQTATCVNICSLTTAQTGADRQHCLQFTVDGRGTTTEEGRQAVHPAGHNAALVDSSARLDNDAGPYQPVERGRCQVGVGGDRLAGVEIDSAESVRFPRRLHPLFPAVTEWRSNTSSRHYCATARSISGAQDGSGDGTNNIKVNDGATALEGVGGLTNG